MTPQTSLLVAASPSRERLFISISPRLPQVGAVVEIAEETCSTSLAEVVASSYRASRRALVVLILNGVSPREVDTALNPVVRSEGLDVQGVLYLSIEDEAAVLSAARAALVVVATSERLSLKLRREGLECLNAHSARELLDSLAPPDLAFPLPPLPRAERCP